MIERVRTTRSLTREENLDEGRWGSKINPSLQSPVNSLVATALTGTTTTNTIQEILPTGEKDTNGVRKRHSLKASVLDSLYGHGRDQPSTESFSRA